LQRFNAKPTRNKAAAKICGNIKFGEAAYAKPRENYYALSLLYQTYNFYFQGPVGFLGSILFLNFLIFLLLKSEKYKNYLFFLTEFPKIYTISIHSPFLGRSKHILFLPFWFTHIIFKLLLFYY